MITKGRQRFKRVDGNPGDQHLCERYHDRKTQTRLDPPLRVENPGNPSLFLSQASPKRCREVRQSEHMENRDEQQSDAYDSDKDDDEVAQSGFDRIGRPVIEELFFE